MPQRTTRSSRPGPGGVAQAQRLALDRAHARLVAEGARPRPGGDDDLLGAAARAERPSTSTPGAQHGAGALGRRARARRTTQARVDGVVVGHVQRAAQRRARAPARARRAALGSSALDAQPEALAQRRARARAPRPRRGRGRASACRTRGSRRRCRSPRASSRGEGRPAPRALAARARAARARRRRPRPPARASRPPRARCPAPSSPRSSTTTDSPRARARQATARPTMPPPTTATS